MRYLGDFPASELDLEIHVPVPGLPGTGHSGGARVLELPATTWASTVHEGAFDRVGEAYRRSNTG
ncbi:hypothetical protein [Prauserella endophytica]|uniref:Uncharacterized protein n=1 Tax=Prauserella endophytica TaxID=1592324 RepID=A0ABY2SAI5_9PSEU|nr:hypothetical protein [Prauserella endophytica]TKG72905.1 hypothetical protein FCN18_06720 [Prauserella endophytica]